MKEKRGFTLIELLAVILILGIIMSISTYFMFNSNKDAENEVNYINENGILNSASFYTTEYNKNLIWNEDENAACISINTLINRGYFERDDIVASGYDKYSVKVTEVGDKVYNYELVNDIYCYFKDFIDPTISIDGDNPLIKNYGESFDLWSDVTVDGTGSDVISKYILNGDKRITNTNELQVGEYVINYYVMDTFENEAKMERQVHIIDNVSPTIDFETPIVKALGEDFDLWSDVTVKDLESGIDNNSKKVINKDNNQVITNTKDLAVGTYNFTYSVSDKTGNVVTKDRQIQIILSDKRFEYKGDEEEFVVPATGYYFVDANGAGTSLFGGLGGNVTGYIYLKQGDVLKVNVGGNNGYNGGAKSDENDGMSGGGATTLAKDGKTLITAAGAGGPTFFCASSTYTAKKPGEIQFPSGSSCFISDNDNDLSGGLGDGYGPGGNGVNGGGGAGIDGELVPACVGQDYKCEEYEIKTCIKYKQTCITMPKYCTSYDYKTGACKKWAGGDRICYPSSTCEQWSISTGSRNCKFSYYLCTATSVGETGRGGKSSVSSDVINVNYIHGKSGNSYNGNLTIKYVGESL